MILHISPDEKFIPFLYNLFEEANPGKSKWRIITSKKNIKFTLNNANTEFHDSQYFYKNTFKEDLKRVDCVIFHSFRHNALEKWRILDRLPEGVTVVWRGWGFDYYHLIENQFHKPFILPETAKLLLSSDDFLFFKIKKIYKIITKILSSNRIETIVERKFLTRVSHFSSCVPDDHDLLVKSCPVFPATFLPLNYYSKEDVFFKGIGSTSLVGKNILLGNSATPSNNHVEAIGLLSQLRLGRRKVIVPLSYGIDSYRKKIINIGEAMLGDNFLPINKYLPLSDYNNIISSCGFTIMNHVRQQGIGNITAQLMRGGKVMLRPENPIYKYYMRKGIKVYPITDDLSQLQTDIDTDIQQHDSEKNENLLTLIWSRAEGLRQAKTITLLNF